MIIENLIVPEKQVKQIKAVTEEKKSEIIPTLPFQRVKYHPESYSPKNTKISVKYQQPSGKSPNNKNISQNETEIKELIKNTEAILKKPIHKSEKSQINKNMEKIILLLSQENPKRNLKEQDLVRISEIGKKYLQGSIQDSLLRVILDEYGRVQKRKIRQLEKEKRSLASTNQLTENFGITKALLNLFPEEVLKNLQTLQTANKEEAAEKNNSVRREIDGASSFKSSAATSGNKSASINKKKIVSNTKNKKSQEKKFLNPEDDWIGEASIKL